MRSKKGLGIRQLGSPPSSDSGQGSPQIQHLQREEVGLASVVSTNSWITESPGMLFRKYTFQGHTHKTAQSENLGQGLEIVLKKQITKTEGFSPPGKLFFLSEVGEMTSKFIGRQPSKGRMASE